MKYSRRESGARSVHGDLNRAMPHLVPGVRQRRAILDKKTPKRMVQSIMADLELAGGRAERRRRSRTVEEQRRMVEEALAPGASVAEVARAHEVNANPVFKWRRLFKKGQLGD
jgi:transposase-like protein